MDAAWQAYGADICVRPDDDGRIAQWFDAQVRAAIGGRQWLVQSEGLDMATRFMSSIASATGEKPRCKANANSLHKKINALGVERVYLYGLADIIR